MNYRKLIFSIVIFILCVPCIVQALDISDEFSVLYTIKIMNGITGMDNSYYYGTEVVYENNEYQLSGTVVSGAPSSLFNQMPEQEFLYTCQSATETRCVIVTTLYNKKFGSPDNRNYLSVKLRNGELAQDKQYFYVGRDYEYQDGIYTLKDYEQHSIFEINRKAYLSRTYEYYYFCPTNYGVSCDDLVMLVNGGNFGSYGEPADIWQYVGEGYQYIGGKYQLIKPEKILPYATEKTGGYTCVSQEDICDDMYQVEMGEKGGIHDGRIHFYHRVRVSNTMEEDSIQLLEEESYTLTDFFTREELENIFVTDEEILEIVNDKIIAKKVGMASIIYENTNVYKELKVVVNEVNQASTSEITNPKTGNTIIFFIMSSVISMGIITFVFLEKKQQKS